MLIDDNLLDIVSTEANSSPSHRINYFFNESLADKVQRLLYAMEPGTIIPIKSNPDTAETIIVLRGILKITLYDKDKNIIEQYGLNPLNGKYGYHFTKGIWYSVETLAPNTVIFEVKDGTYTPLASEDIVK